MRIWVPKFKCVEPKRELVLQSGFRGYLRLEARRPNGTVRASTGWFPNLITDAGLDRLGTAADYLQRCVVGSGSTAPAVEDTQLEAQVATTTTTVTSDRGVQTDPPVYGYTIKTFRFATGAAAGNLSEVGIGWAAGVFSRALIVDGEGQPTTLTVLSDETLDVTYELRLYSPENDVEDEITIGDTAYDVVARAALINDATYSAIPAAGSIGGPYAASVLLPSRVHAGPIGLPSAAPSGSFDARTSAELSNYTPGDFFRDGLFLWGLNAGNFPGGIQSVLFRLGQTNTGGGLGATQVGIDPPIPKDATKVLTLPLRHSWGRYVP